VTNQQDVRYETPRGLIVHFNNSADEHLGQVRLISAWHAFIKLSVRVPRAVCGSSKEERAWVVGRHERQKGQK
jgi:hypothetical protein